MFRVWNNVFSGSAYASTHPINNSVNTDIKNMHTDLLEHSPTLCFSSSYLSVQWMDLLKSLKQEEDKSYTAEITIDKEDQENYQEG